MCCAVTWTASWRCKHRPLNYKGTGILLQIFLTKEAPPFSSFPNRQKKIPENIPSAPLEAPPAHTRTLDTQSLPTFAFQICLLTFPPSLLLSISCFSLPPLRGGTATTFYRTFSISRRPEAALKNNNLKTIYFLNKKEREKKRQNKTTKKPKPKTTEKGSCGKEKEREKEENACQLQVAAVPACTRVAFCSPHINASSPPKLFPLEWTYQRFSASLERAVPDNAGFPCQFLPTRLWQHFLPDTLILTHTYRSSLCVCVCFWSSFLLLYKWCSCLQTAGRKGKPRATWHLHSTLLICDSCSVLPSL